MGVLMEQPDILMHEVTMIAINPFGVPMDGPLQNHASAAKLPPKLIDPTDANGIGGRHPIG